MLKISDIAAPTIPTLEDNYGSLVIRWRTGGAWYQQEDDRSQNDFLIDIDPLSLTIARVTLLLWNRTNTGDQEALIRPGAEEIEGLPIADREQFAPNSDLQITKRGINVKAPTRLIVHPHAVAMVMGEEAVTRWIRSGAVRFGLTVESEIAIIEVDRAAIPYESPFYGNETTTPEVIRLNEDWERRPASQAG